MAQKMMFTQWVFLSMLVLMLTRGSHAVLRKEVSLDVKPTKIDFLSTLNLVNVKSYVFYIYRNPLPSTPVRYVGTPEFTTALSSIDLGVHRDKDIYHLEVEVEKTTDPGHFQLDVSVTPMGQPKYSSHVFGDPHVYVPLKNSDQPLCYELTGYDSDVLELISVRESGITVNAKLDDPKHRVLRYTKLPKNLFVGEVAILHGRSSVFISPRWLVLNKGGREYEWQTGTIMWRRERAKDIPINIARNRVIVDIGSGIGAVIERKSMSRLDVTFTNLYAGIKAELDGVIGGVASRIQGQRYIKKKDGSKAIILKVGHKDIEVKSDRMGNMDCWKIHNAIERIFGSDVITMRRPCLFCPNNQKNWKYRNVFG